MLHFVRGGQHYPEAPPARKVARVCRVLAWGLCLLAAFWCGAELVALKASGQPAAERTLAAILSLGKLACAAVAAFAADRICLLAANVRSLVRPKQAGKVCRAEE